MGYSDSRSKELTQRLRDLTPAPSAAETARLQDGIDTYIREREDPITSFLAILGDTSDKRLGDLLACLDRWGEAVKRLGNCLGSSSSDTSTAALAFVTRACFEEQQAIDSLRATNAAAAHDVFIYRTRIMEEKITALADKWERMNGESRYFDDLEQRAIDSVRSLVNEVIAKTAPAVDQMARVPNNLYEAMRREIKLINDAVVDLGRSAGLDDKKLAKWKQAVQLIDPGGKLRSKLTGELAQAAGLPKAPADDQPTSEASAKLSDVARTMLQFSNALLSQRVQEYRDAIRRRTDGLLVLFTDTYQDTKKFIEENGFDKAKARYQETSDTLDRWVSSLPTDGLKSDFGALSKDILDRLSRHLRDLETMFNRFVHENEGRFFGPLGPDISEALTETRKWEEARVGLLNLGLEEKVRSFRSSLQQFIVVDMRSAIEKSELELQYFDPEIQKELRVPFEAFRDQVIKDTEELIRRVDEICERQRSVFSSDIVTAYLDRRILKDRLPS